MDQTYGYVATVDLDGDLTFTTKHPEVILFDTKEQAQKIVNADREAYRKLGIDPDLACVDVYEVVDEIEFRSRKDTW